METLKPISEPNFQSELDYPFEPLVLQRPMTLFPTVLGLKPLAAGLPSDEWIANLWSGRPTYLAIIRRGFGKDFKNFENYAQQRVKTTAVVEQRLIDAWDGNRELLELLASWKRDDVLVPNIASFARVVEDVTYQVMKGLSSGSHECPNCKAQLISNPMRWWREQSCSLGDAEYRFVDRVLYDVFAITLLPYAFEPWARKKGAAEKLVVLCRADGHIFKNWLTEVRGAFRAKDLASLATRAGLSGPSPDSHLQRCARGEMLTLDTIEEVTSRLNDPEPLRGLGMKARALAFAVDFIVASDHSPTPVTWSAAQAILGARLERLYQDMELKSLLHVRSEKL